MTNATEYSGGGQVLTQIKLLAEFLRHRVTCTDLVRVKCLLNQAFK